MTALLESRSLTHAYAGAPEVLRELDLALHHGDRMALSGPNGSGKSTLLFHMNGTLRPQRGAIHLNGVRLGYSREQLLAWRRQVGLVLQNPDDQIFAPTVYEDISFGPLNLDLPGPDVRERVEWAMEALSISDLCRREPHQLSHGQKKRVAIAGVMAMRPDVLLLDEPIEGLDRRGAQSLLDTLHELSANGATILLTTHDLRATRGWATRLAIMQDGRVSEETAPLTTKRQKLAQVSICMGCCCGRTDKGFPEIPVNWLKAQWKEKKLLKRVQLSISGCLGPCDLANVIRVSSSEGEQWIGNLTERRQFEQLVTWAEETNRQDRLLPLPEEYRSQRFEVFR